MVGFGEGNEKQPRYIDSESDIFFLYKFQINSGINGSSIRKRTEEKKKDKHDSCGKLPYFRVFEPVSNTNGHVQGYSLNFKLVEILSEKSPNRQQNLQNHILFLQTGTVKCTENAFAEVRFFLKI